MTAKASKPRNTAPKAKPVAKIVSGSKLFGERLTGAKMEIGGYTFHLRSIPNFIVIWFTAKCTDAKNRVDNRRSIIQYVKWGVTGIYDDAGEVVEYDRDRQKYMDHEFTGMADDHLFAIPADWLYPLYLKIYDLTHLTERERESLDFSTPSGSQTSGTDAETAGPGSEKAGQSDHAPE